jgi:hypothetical protein
VRWQDLDGDGAIEAPVSRFVDLAHPAGPDGRVDLIRAEANAGRQGHQSVAGLYGGRGAYLPARRSEFRELKAIASLHVMR